MTIHFLWLEQAMKPLSMACLGAVVPMLALNAQVAQFAVSGRVGNASNHPVHAKIVITDSRETIETDSMGAFRIVRHSRDSVLLIVMPDGYYLPKRIAVHPGRGQVVAIIVEPPPATMTAYTVPRAESPVARDRPPTAMTTTPLSDSLLRTTMRQPPAELMRVDSASIRDGVIAAFALRGEVPRNGQGTIQVTLVSSAILRCESNLGVTRVLEPPALYLYVSKVITSSSCRGSTSRARWVGSFPALPAVTDVVVVVDGTVDRFELRQTGSRVCVVAHAARLTSLVAGPFPEAGTAEWSDSTNRKMIGFPVARLSSC